MKVFVFVSAVLVTLAVLLGGERNASAHDVRGEIVFLDVGENAVQAEIQVPPRQLAAARGHDFALGEDLAPYVREHLRAEARDGRPFDLEIQHVGMENVTDGEALVVRARFIAPRGASARYLVLNDEIILHRVVTHNVYVFVRRDLRIGELGESATFAGISHYQQKRLVIDRTTDGSLFTAFRAVFKLGVRHLADGADHLLFLLALLMVAPLALQNGRWTAVLSVRASLRRIAAIVTAFTVGHSLTLAFGALGGPTPPTSIIEVIVAISIAVSALHALKPIPFFVGREAIVAGVFGLFHGLAFASALAGFGFDRSTLLLSLLGFNVGVEAMQLLVVALTMPWLILLSRSRFYGVIRVFGAAFAGIALGWIGERAFQLHTPMTKIAESLTSHAPLVVFALGVIAIAEVATRRTEGYRGMHLEIGVEKNEFHKCSRVIGTFVVYRSRGLRYGLR